MIPKYMQKKQEGPKRSCNIRQKSLCGSFNMNAHVPKLFGKTSQLLVGLILFYGITCQNVGGCVGTLCVLKKLNANASYSYCSWQDRQSWMNRNTFERKVSFNFNSS